MGAAARTAIPQLVQLASKGGDEGKPFREALVQIGSASVPEILRVVEGQPLESLTTGHWSIECLQQMDGSVIPVMSKALTSPSTTIRLVAAQVLGGMKYAAVDAAPNLSKACEDADPQVRASALTALVAVRASSSLSTPRVEAGFKDPAPEVRAAALRAVPELGGNSRSFAPEVLAALRDPERTVRAAAIRALEPGSTAAVPVLVEKLSDPAMHEEAAEALGNLGSAGKPALPRMVEMWPGAGRELRLKLLRAFAAIGHDAREALPIAIAAVKDGDAEIRSAAVHAVGRIEHEVQPKLPFLSAALGDAEESVRRSAAVAVADLGDRGHEAAPALIALLDKSSDREFALDALRKLRLNSLPQLISALDHQALEFRALACERLAELGPAARDAVPSLKRQLEAPSEDLQRAARRALRRIDG
jgi:HEAT repeat protein